MPRVSICIPAFRAEKYLPAALDSVRAQTFPHWELIALLDADDCWRPAHLETTVGKLLESGADLAHAGSLLFPSFPISRLGTPLLCESCM